MTPRCILIVDDEPLLLRSMERHVVKAGWTVVTEADSRRAVDRLVDARAHVLIADTWMPHVDGPALLAVVRERYPTVVRVLMSGSSDSDTLKRARDAGLAHHVLNKPWPPGELPRLLEEIHASLTADAVRSGAYVADPAQVADALVASGDLDDTKK
jgi:DNA-binding NtrC family response regulator